MVQRVAVWDIFSIPLSNNKFMYVLHGNGADMVFFRLLSNERNPWLSRILESNPLFHSTVYKHVLSSWEWPKIGKIEKELVESEYPVPIELIYDVIDDYLRLYVNWETPPNPIPFEQAYDLGFAEVHEKHSIEQILEYYAETGFYHPRVWDIAYWDDCITHLRPGKYKLKPEHREHALNIRKRYGVLGGKVAP